MFRESLYDSRINSMLPFVPGPFVNVPIPFNFHLFLESWLSWHTLFFNIQRERILAHVQLTL